MQSKKNVKIIKERLLEHYPSAKTELVFKNNFELLVCVMLSAQCTDKRVNLITPALFERYPDAKSLAAANLSSLKLLINSCSFFNNKAQNLIKMAQALCQKHAGEVPLDENELKALAGVGVKTAHVVLIEALGANFMAVDTHVFRISKRLDLLKKAKVPEQADAELSKLFKTDLNRLHQAMIIFGRYTCKAIKPHCEDCFLSEFCKEKTNKI